MGGEDSFESAVQDQDPQELNESGDFERKVEPSLEIPSSPYNSHEKLTNSATAVCGIKSAK